MDKDEQWNVILRIGGCIGGGTCSIGLLFVGVHDILNIVIKVVGVLFMAAATGIVTSMGGDFYRLKIKNKVFKSKINDQ